MGKGGRKAQARHAGQKGGGTGPKKMQNYAKLSTKGKPKNQNQENKQQQQKHNQPIIPFKSSDRILLVGEGDFSFALSLAKHHGCHQRVLATSYDSEEKVYEKYPQTKRHMEEICTFSPSSTSSSTGQRKRKRDDEDDNKGSEEDSEAIPTTTDKKEAGISSLSSKQHGSNPPNVLFSIDARKLGAVGGGGKLIRNGFPRQSSNKRRRISHANENPSHGSKRKENDSTMSSDSGGPWDIISFNFPHVGGLSTDVNRQVRSNQELLVSFFKACVPLLSTPLDTNEYDSDQEDDWDNYGDESYPDYDDEEEDPDNTGAEYPRRKPQSIRKEPGQIIVTLFEGEPYTLWNIRDLARHAGLRVATSFKFPWSSYPGYSHARTIGEIEGKDGGRGGWKGEDRNARSYVFERKDHEHLGGNGNKAKHGKRGKKKNMSDDSDSD